MSGVDLLGAYVVADSTIGAGALIGAGLTAGSLAGLGIAADEREQQQARKQ